MNYSAFLKNGKEISYSIYQRASDGKWVGAIEMGKNEKGKRQRKVIYASSEKEAKRKVGSIITDMENGEYYEPNKDTLIGFLNTYHKICSSKWESTTVDLYRMYIDVHFEPYFEKTKLSDIKPITLDKFYNYKLSTPRKVEIKTKNQTIKKTMEPLSINSVRKLNTFLKAAFNYAIKNNMIKVNPTNNVSLAKKEKFIPKVYSEEQFLELYNEVQGTEDEVPIILGAGCGFRRGEIFGLRWENIDFDSRTITIKKTNVRFNKYTEKKPKNETSQRTIAVPDDVLEVLLKHKGNAKPSDKVITKWKPGSYTERFVGLLDKHNLPRIRLHDLRHYNAVVMMNKGIPDKVAAQRLGQSQINTLRDVYQHVLQDMDITAANKINETFRKNNNSQTPGEE